MAYVDAEKKAELAPAIKAVLKKYDMKGTISVGNHMTLIVKIKSGAIDFAPFFQDAWDYQVNDYHIETNYYGVARDFLLELKAAMQGEKWFCEDDVMTDYFHRSHFITINIGRYDKPYVYNKSEKAA